MAERLLYAELERKKGEWEDGCRGAPKCGGGADHEALYNVCLMSKTEMKIMS